MRASLYRIRVFLSCLLLIPVFSLLVSCGVSYTGVDAVTQVTPARGENLGKPCVYELILAKPLAPPATSQTQQGVFVVFDRGDSAALFTDPSIRQMLQTLHFGFILAHECDAASYSDLQSNAFAGPGRALFQALAQFGVQTGHAELAHSNLAAYGFSASAVLAADLANYAPSRVLGVIAYAAGSAHTDISSLSATNGALGVPSLFLANSKDENSGTERSLEYFEQGRQQGALWSYAVQDGVGHCCNKSTIPMVLAWLPGVVALRGVGPTLQNVAPASGVEGYFICSPDDTTDAQKDKNCLFTLATLTQSATATESSVWLPGSQAAQAWLAWVAAKTGDS